MSADIKPVDALRVVDIETNPVWRFTVSRSGGEANVRPVKKLPVNSLTGKLVGTQVRFANGTLHWALIGNVDVGNPRLTEQFLTITIEKNGNWFTLARYFDFDHEERGPESLGRFLKLSPAEIFPISYDITQYVAGESDGLSGLIQKEPRERLTRAEIIALAVP